MATVFEALPGIEVAVPDVIRTLADIWELDRRDAGPGAPSAFRASQMNLLLHLGLGTSPEEGAERFCAAVRFAQRYPCRIVVLVPVEARSESAAPLQAKVFAECHIGPSRRSMTCCEAILLSYAWKTRAFLENHVSTLLETDLPLYYWPHHFVVGSRIGDYLFFTQAAKRILVDSAVEQPELVQAAWPRPEAVRDLVFARLLPVRQALGQFLGAYAPADLVEGLTAVEVSAAPAYRAEGRVLARWMSDRIAACQAAAGRTAETAPPLMTRDCPADAPHCFRVEWRYAGTSKSFRWTADLASGLAETEADFGGGRLRLPTTIKLLSEEAALAEAMFF